MEYLGEEAYTDDHNAQATQLEQSHLHHSSLAQTLASQLAVGNAATSTLPHTPQQQHRLLENYDVASEASDTNAELPFDPNDPYNGMPPPPQLAYPSLDQLMAACQEHGRAHGYACVTSSNNYRRGIAYVRCDRGGEYVNHWNVTPETRVRKNRTRRLVGCKWKARAKRNTTTDEWTLTMMDDKHTGHGPSRDLSRHPSLRQLPDDAVSEARQLFEQGRTPKEVLERLKQWNAVITAQDVYNLKAKIQRATKDRQTPGQRATTSRKLGASSAEAGAHRGNIAQMVDSDGMNDVMPLVDPALGASDASAAAAAAVVTGIARLTEAVAQMQETPIHDDEFKVNLETDEGHKCQCNCCDH